MLITLLTSLALAAEAPPASASFEDAAQQLYAEQGVLQQTWHVVPSRSGYYVANAKGKRVSTQSVLRLGDDAEAIARVNRLHYASRFGVGLGLAPIAAGIWTESPRLMVGGAVVGAPFAMLGLALGYRLRQTGKFMEMDTADTLVDLHNHEVLAMEGVSEEEISGMLMRSQMLYIETTPSGDWRVRQGTDLLAPSEFALLVGDSGKLGRFAVGSTAALVGSAALGVVATAGVLTAGFGLFATALSVFNPVLLPLGLAALGVGSLVAFLAGSGAIAILGGYQVYKAGYDGWYTDEELQERVDTHNALVRGEIQASGEPKPEARVQVQARIGRGQLGLSGTF